jgi:hypothetical protein
MFISSFLDREVIIRTADNSSEDVVEYNDAGETTNAFSKSNNIRTIHGHSGLRTAETEGIRFSLKMRAAYGQVMRK